MSIWRRLGEIAVHAAAHIKAGVTNLIGAVRSAVGLDPELRRRVAFSVAMIALSAKMAKADGVVTQDEIRAFHEIFSAPQSELKNVARLYDLAQQDIAGFEHYAELVVKLCGSGKSNCVVLEDILDGLFHIAKADGLLHERENGFLLRIAEIFSISEAHYRTIAARHVNFGEADPYVVLGVQHGAAFRDIRKTYRQLVAENHPDRLIGRGMPEEFIAIATRRLAAINAAFDVIERELQPA